jgi:hypothetical protein
LKIELANTLIRKAGLIRAVQHELRIDHPELVLELLEILDAIENARREGADNSG